MTEKFQVVACKEISRISIRSLKSERFLTYNVLVAPDPVY